MIVYVAGDMHSGTTLVGQLIAAHLDATMVGEVGPTLAVYRTDKRCDCGLEVTRCPVWSRVVVTEPLQLAARRAYAMSRTPVQLLSAALRRATAAEQVVADALVALASQPDEVLVDTSKIPSGSLLWRSAGQQVVVVHCVRSPWGVARSKAAPQSAALSRHRSVAANLARWAGVHAATAAGRLTANGYVRVSFSRLLRDPEHELMRIAAAVRPGNCRPAMQRRSFDIARSHIVEANPRRRKQGTIAIRKQATHFIST